MRMQGLVGPTFQVKDVAETRVNWGFFAVPMQKMPRFQGEIA
jgi:hypothetical protein